MASIPVYCLCGKPYDPTKFMIKCDACALWLHGGCVGVDEHQSSDIDKYHCPKCEKMFGPSIAKRRTNWHRHDYAEENADNKAVQTGTPVFIKELKSRHFPNADEVLVFMRGQQLTLPYLMQNGFDRPIMIETTDGLGLMVPPSTFTVEDIERYLGSGWEIDAIDVTKQEDIHMTFNEFVRYFNSPTRTKVINVISLEFSNSKLAAHVDPPYIVNKLSWIHNIWPDTLPEGCLYSKPEVQKYCLIGVRDSYTDFHIDFGGSSVWYHVLRGEKVFYLIRPTQANLALYKRWMASSNRSETFFGDQVDACYRCTVKQGQTLLIPTAWIHAVFTPVDSLVIGGNFLHSLNLPLQLQVYDIEKRLKTAEKFRFPYFETCNWYAAKHILDELKDQNTTDRKPLPYLVQGAKVLVSALKNWTQDKDHLKSHKEEIPLTINYLKLIKDLAKEVRHAEKAPQNKKQNLRQLPPRDRRGRGLAKLGVQTLSKQEVAPVVTATPKPKPENTHKLMPKQESPGIPSEIVGNDVQMPLKLFISKHGPNDDATVSVRTTVALNPSLGNVHFDASAMVTQQTPSTAFIVKSQTGTPLAPPTATAAGSDKLDDSVYDFHDSDEDSLVVDENPPPRLPSRKNGCRKIKDYGRKQGPFKLKLSLNKSPPSGSNTEGGSLLIMPEGADGTAIESDATPSSPKLAGIEELLRASGYATAESAQAAGAVVVADATAVYTDDLQEGHIIVEEIIRPVESNVVLKTEEVQEGEEIQMDGDADDPFVAAQSGRASPSTREAIQGMLSMGRAVQFSSALSYPPNAINSEVVNGQQSVPPASLSPITETISNVVNAVYAKKSSPTSAAKRKSQASHHPPPKKKRKSKALANTVTEEDEFLGNCHQDDEFVYPSLEASDDDRPVFKSRGRSKTDEAWNPKARLVPNFPKPERPIREGVRKEAVESGLAAAAARLAHLPAPKRPYHRRKPAKAKSRQSPSLSMDAVPGTSTEDPNVFDPSAPLTPKSLGPFKGKKAKKGFATAKQRLGRILKIHKMLY